MTKARLVVAKPLTLNGVDLKPGDEYAALTFPNQALAEHFRATLHWSAIQVVIDGAAEPQRGADPIAKVEGLAGFTAALESVGIATAAQLAGANPKAMRRVQGIGEANAGALMRAAKRHIAGIVLPKPKAKAAPSAPAAEGEPPEGGAPAGGESEPGDGKGKGSKGGKGKKK